MFRFKKVEQELKRVRKKFGSWNYVPEGRNGLVKSDGSR